MSINKIKNPREIAFDGDRMKVTIETANGEIIYQNEVFATIMLMIEDVKQIDYETTEVEATRQFFMFGRPSLIMYAFDHIQSALKRIGSDLAGLYKREEAEMKKRGCQSHPAKNQYRCEECKKELVNLLNNQQK